MILKIITLVVYFILKWYVLLLIYHILICKFIFWQINQSFYIIIFYQSINQSQSRITNITNPKHLSIDQNPHNLGRIYGARVNATVASMLLQRVVEEE